MLDYSDSPPPLHHSPTTSEKVLPTSRESTPRTPVGFAPSLSRRPDKDRGKDGHLPWFKRPIDIGAPAASLFLDSSLLEPDFDDHSFPLFGASPPAQSMAHAAAPINIVASHASTSPRRQQSSNLTFALQENADGGARRLPGIAADERADNLEGGKSVNMGDAASPWTNGAKPISMAGASRDKIRRESVAQSLTGGTSWGGISVGSWIRDDIMSGTSPLAFGNSPSYHSSSYLPKLEANFMRDFSCCGTTLPSLHDLLQHYEEAHAQKTSPATVSSTAEQQQQQQQQQQQMPDARAAVATSAAASVQQQAQQHQTHQHRDSFTPIAPAKGSTSSNQPQQNQPKPSALTSNLQTIPDMDTVEDMEMDDIDGGGENTPPPTLFPPPQSNNDQSPQSQFNQAHPPRVPRLSMNLMPGHQGLRNSTPTTPVSQGRPGAPFQNDPTVSSVNTPTLMTNPMQQQFQDQLGQHRGTPDSSAPGTPAELDESIMSGIGHMSMQTNLPLVGNRNLNLGLGGYGTNNDMLDLCIDEPAKRLFSPTGGYGTQSQQYAHMRLGSGQYGPDSDIARRIREQQMLAGVPDTTAGMMPNDEPKPFRCPVIGCEKAYKNQNGLKYHKSHGHNSQRLHDNADGTFSIVNPETSVPYEGTLGMEKEKPYRCETCGKRYKNLNGLKYHKSHSPPCNPELQVNGVRSSASTGLTPNQSQSQDQIMGISGAGLSVEAGIA